MILKLSLEMKKRLSMNESVPTQDVNSWGGGIFSLVSPILLIEGRGGVPSPARQIVIPPAPQKGRISGETVWK